jgi:hypothetical protein
MRKRLCGKKVQVLGSRGGLNVHQIVWYFDSSTSDNNIKLKQILRSLVDILELCTVNTMCIVFSINAIVYD